jgi:hypothetical protein
MYRQADEDVIVLGFLVRTSGQMYVHHDQIDGGGLMTREFTSSISITCQSDAVQYVVSSDVNF